MPLNRPRIDPKPLTPYPRRVTLVLPRIALRADLGASGGTLTRWPRSPGARPNRPLEIVGVCNDCTGRSLRSSTIAGRDRWSPATIAATDDMLDRSSFSKEIRSKVRIPISPYARVRVCVRALCKVYARRTTGARARTHRGGRARASSDRGRIYVLEAHKLISISHFKSEKHNENSRIIIAITKHMTNVPTFGHTLIKFFLKIIHVKRTFN